MTDNIGATLIRALKLPLRDVHDICSTGDLEYLQAFALDEEHRAEKGLGRAHSPSRKPTAPVRRAEILQGSKVAEKLEAIREKKELKNRQKKREAAKQRRLDEEAAEARGESGADGGGDESEGGSQGPLTPRQDLLSTNAGGADGYDDEHEVRTESQISESAVRKNLLLSSGKGAKKEDAVDYERVFPRPRLGQTQLAATEDAIFNTVGLNVVSMDDLINFRDEHGFLPIHTACIFGHYNVVQFLLSHGADIESEAPKTLYRPLHLAVLNGHDALARKLVDVHSADPGAMTANFELPLTIARSRRAAVEQLYYKDKCAARIRSHDALEAAKNGDVLFFSYHAECDDDHGKAVFTDNGKNAFVKSRPKDKAPESTAGGHSFSVEHVIRESVCTPLDVAIASISSSPIDNKITTESKNFFRIAQILLRGKYFALNEPRESSIATTTLYLAVTLPVAREAISLLLEHGADPRVASTFSAAASHIIKLIVGEAEAKTIFDETYATRDEVDFMDRQDFILKVAELRAKWKMASHKLKKALEREEAINAANAVAAAAQQQQQHQD